MRNTILALLIHLAAVGVGGAQSFAPPGVKPPDQATRDAIAERTQRLSRALAVMYRQGVRDPVAADVEVFHKAAVWAVRHNEFFHEQSGAWTLEVLDRGLLRVAQALRGESPWLQADTHATVRAFRSRIDGSIQPYAVTFPRDYGKDPHTRWRVDVLLHGRDNSLSEVKFLHQHSGLKAAATDQPYVLLEIFGRGNNAYRWAGESDILEAIDAFVATERWLGRGDRLDPARVVLRGFSMGGAGTWHLGLHRPDRWCVIGPGAGFSTTRGYWKELPASLPGYVEACLHIYDAVDYAENAALVPVVAYAGDKDPQLQAARNIQAKLQPKKIPMTLLIGKDLEHKFPPPEQLRAETEYTRYAAPGKGRAEYRNQIHFTTYTLKYPGSDWVEILGLQQHYQLAQVDATRLEHGFAVTTKNVRQMRLGLPGSDASTQRIRIDGQTLDAKPSASADGLWSVYLEQRAGRWFSVLPQLLQTDRQRRWQKISNLQGPIDDAFMESFLCVRGTGTPWHAEVQKYADEELKRFQQDWDKFFRGELPIRADTDVSDEDIANKHLILFGDPASNSLIAQVVDKLPLQWTKTTLTMGTHNVASADHVPVLIYPSPLNPNRYVVLNSGHTFRAEDHRGTNARLFPRLGDYALLKLLPGNAVPRVPAIVHAGLFDDFWTMPHTKN